MALIDHDQLASDLQELHHSWGWLLALGVVFVALGALCIIRDVTATFVSVRFFGALLLVGGVLALVQAIRVHNWRGSLLNLLSALLRGFTGYLVLRYPESGALAVTLVLACFFVVGGLFRAIGAAKIQFPRWGWVTFSGLLSLALGVLLLMHLPLTSIWFIGFAIGVDAVVDGISLIGVALAVQHIPVPTVHRAA